MPIRIIFFLSEPRVPRVRNHMVIELSFEYDIWGDTEIRGVNNCREIVEGPFD